MRNPFRRPVDAPASSLCERAADLSARLASAIRTPDAAAPAPSETEDAATLEDFATIDFAAYALDEPVKTPREWGDKFASAAMALHVADRTLRMTKPELIAFIRDAGKHDAATPEIMFRNLDGSQETLKGWGNLLGLARARYIVAASAACLEPDASDETAPPNAPPTGAFAPAPSDLAAACLWAVQHRAWIDETLTVEDWSDDRWDAETAKTNAVFTRAITEPSVSLSEITAKAALALEDYERFKVSSAQTTDDGDRIVHTVLREVAAFRAEATAPPSIAATPVPTPARDLTREAFDYAWGLDLRSVPFGNLTRLYDLFHRVAEILSDAGDEKQFWIPSIPGVFTSGGELLDAEQNRFGCLRDACAEELTRRVPETDTERDKALTVRIAHEMLCEGKIRSQDTLAEIKRAWGG